MNRIAGRAGVVLLLVALLVVGFSFFLCEYVMEAGDWAIFPGSPHVYDAGNLDRGVVTDRDGVLLLDMRGGKTYSGDELLRMSTVHWLGDRYGSVSAPVLPNYAQQLVGYDLLNGMYSYGGSDGVITTTLSSKVQIAALEAMGDYKGTVAVYNYRTGEILCAITTPTYDPDHIPDVDADTEGKFEGVYLNRFTQSTYIPGSIFKIVTLAAALETIPDIESRSFVCTGSCTVGSDVVNCDDIHWDQSLKMAFRNSCNCAFAELALELGAETLDRYIKQFSVTEPVTFDGLTTAAGNAEVLNTSSVNVAWSAIGQYNDQINPCAFLTYVGALANGGKGAMPYLVQEVSVGDKTTYEAKTQEGNRIMSATAAKILREYMQFNVQDKYGSENFPGLTVCAKTGTAEVGGEKKPNAMLAGFVADDKYPLAFIVCVEDAGYGKTVCIPIASTVLAACKAEMDG
ncbi:MAG: penicillin-binding protein [Oscillospiraceae bacterium]|nr:penicillin-binding protein [Oscillospiraceae bacterium]